MAIDKADGSESGPSGESSDVFAPGAPLVSQLTSENPQLYPGLSIWGGRFQIVRRIGAGGMGVVHEAHDRERGENVALKTLSRLDPAGIYRLKNEFRALAEVVHPNLVRLHELFADRKLWLFTMELIRGEPFLQWVRPAGVLDERRLRHGLSQLAAGVRAIHAAGKLHRDLKPSNVLVGNDGRVVILDFGLVADPEAGGPGQTMADDRISGTPSYISPEQAAGDAPTAASDWYGVGVLLFEALTGRLPFAERGYVVMQRKQSVPPPLASSIAPQIPGDLDTLCATLLARAPEQRPDGEQIARVAAAHAPLAAVAKVVPESPGTALVGRQAELDALRSAFAAAAAGQAVVARVSGESGAGKSTLVRAFLDELRAQGSAVLLSGRCYERESVPYKAIDRMIDALTRFLRQLPEIETATLIPRDIGALARIFPVLERIDIVAAAPARAAPDDQELRRRAFEALTELIAGIRDRHMLVLHVDDLQWIDHDSTLLFEHLLGQPDPPPLLLIAGHRGSVLENPLLARVDAAARSNPAVQVHEIALGPLALDAARELALRLLQASGSDAALADAVAAAAEGNPFFVGELSRYATHAGAHGGAMSLRDAIHRRAADLSDPSRHLLELLAISGRPTPGDVLVRAAGALEDAQHALDLLRGAQLVREGSGRTYECYHDRIREAFTDRLTPEEIRQHHMRLGAAWSERTNTDPEILFEHWRAAGEDARAAACAVQAGENAGNNLAFERSAAFFTHAIGLLPEAESERLNLRERMAEALSLAGRWTEAGHAFAEAERRATEPSRRTSLLQRSALHFLGTGHSGEGLPRLQQLFAQDGVPWPKSRLSAIVRAVARLFWLWVRGARRPSAPEAPSAQDVIMLERLLDGAGLVPPYDMARGLYFMAQFASRALRSPDLGQVGVASALLSALFSSSRFTRRLANRLATDACALARNGHQANLACSALSFVAYGRLLEGRAPEAAALGAEAEALLHDSQLAHIYQAWTARSVQSSALLVMGRVGEAAVMFEASARLARELGDDMAMVGGDSPLRFLMIDDLERAFALIEHKQAVIARAKTYGVLHEIVRIERVLCLLYAGRGAEVLLLAKDSPRLARFFDPSMLAACAALQVAADSGTATALRGGAADSGTAPALRGGAADSGTAPALRGGASVERAMLGLVKKTLRRLQRSEPTAETQAMTAQLEAALRLRVRDTDGALLKLAVAAERYATAGMALHEALIQWRIGRLRGGREGERSIEQARRFMSAQGIVRPEAWARMLASGLDA